MTKLRADAAKWIVATGKPVAAFAGSMLLLAIVADRHNRWLVTIVALALVAASSWLNDAISRARRDTSYDVGRARLVVSTAQLVLAVAAVIASRAGLVAEAIGFTGLGLAIVATGAYVSEARRSRWGEHVRGPIILWSAFFAMAAALAWLSPAASLVAFLAIGAVAELGTELRSEDRLREPAWDARAVCGAGAVMLGIAVVLLVAGGAGSLGAAIAVIVVLVVVGLAASDSDALLIVVVVAFGLVWASAPRGVTADARLTPHGNDDYFLVLGDSYTSGEGASKFYDGTNTTESNADHTNECRQAPTAWPVRLAVGPPANVPTHELFLACSGALTAHIRATPLVDEHGAQHGPAELVQFGHLRTELGLTKPPAFVLLGVGGNDAGFGTIGQACVGPGDCAEVGDVFLDGLRKVEANLDVTYRDVRAAVGDGVPVIVHPYPVPINESGPCSNVLLTANERHFVVRFVEQLNDVVKSAAARNGFLYMDTVESALTSTESRLCDGPGPAGINFLAWNPKAGTLWDSIDPLNWLHDSLHPNERGHEAIEQAARRWFATHSLTAPPPSGGAPHTVPALSSLFEFGTTKVCHETAGHSCDVDGNGWLFEQVQRLLVADLLPLALAAVGAWLILMTAIRWAAEHDITSATLFRRLLSAVWRR